MEHFEVPALVASSAQLFVTLFQVAVYPSYKDIFFYYYSSWSTLKCFLVSLWAVLNTNLDWGQGEAAYLGSLPAWATAGELMKDLSYWSFGGPTANTGAAYGDQEWTLEALKHSLAIPFLLYWFLMDSKYVGAISESFIIILSETFIY